MTTASYNTGVGTDVVRPGTKIFTLRAVDPSGGIREISRVFQLNFVPDSWFSGPDPNQPIYTVNGRERYYEVTDWRALPSFPGSLLSCDSLNTWPAERPVRKTFFQIFDPDGAGPIRDRIYVRSENDTIHLNSWVLVHGGGRDIDSPYLVKVKDFDRTRDTVICATASPLGYSKNLRPVLGLVQSANGGRVQRKRDQTVSCLGLWRVDTWRFGHPRTIVAAIRWRYW